MGILLTNPLDPQISPHQRFSHPLRSDQVTAAAAEATPCPSDVFRASPGAGTGLWFFSNPKVRISGVCVLKNLLRDAWSIS